MHFHTFPLQRMFMLSNTRFFHENTKNVLKVDPLFPPSSDVSSEGEAYYLSTLDKFSFENAWQRAIYG